MNKVTSLAEFKERENPDKALKAYAMLGYDPVDFLEYVQKELNVNTKKLLIKMLTTYNPMQNERNIELNKLGVNLLGVIDIV